MRIQNNISALNAHRMLAGNNGALSKNVEKLSSGFRVNRAADDAAGLAISEKMRTQIRGLNMASKNSQDGISLIQTAEGAMQAIHNVLQRQRELAVQSANGTNDDQIDRRALDLEFQQLTREIDDITTTTTFNGMKVLDGLGTDFKPAATQASNIVILGEGNSLSQLQADQIGLTTTGTNWANVSGKNLTNLQNEIANVIAPNSVDAIMATFNSALDILDGAKIGIGLSHGSLPGGAAGMVSWTFGIQDGTHFIDLRLSFDSGYLASITNADGTLRADKADEFKGIVAHEMMHAVMAVTTTYGMSSFRSDGFQGSQFPIWFREGMAQAVSGPIGWLNSLGPSPTDQQIRNFMGSMPTGTASSSGQGIYGAGYLAAMYLGHLVGDDDIGAGLDTVLRELAAGASLDTIIDHYTNFSGLTAFQNHVTSPNATFCTFVRDLINDTGHGAGSVLGDLDDNMSSIISNTPTSPPQSFLLIDTGYSFVRNIYPDDFNVVAGGGARIAGHPLFDDGSQNTTLDRTGAQDIPPNIRPGSGSTGTLILQVGANAADTMVVHIGDVSTTGLGLIGVNVGTQSESSDALEYLTEAINMVSMHRAELGAYQNRLEFKIQYLDNSAENLAASESRIRDVDMAKSMTDFTKNQILMQAATSMLAQANAIPQGVLALLA